MGLPEFKDCVNPANVAIHLKTLICQFQLTGSTKTDFMNANRACRAGLLLLTALVTWLPASAQSSDIPKVSTAYALTNATVVEEPGVVTPNTTVIIENGLIQAVGAKVPIPSHARVIKCDSMYLYAGFIEGISHTGIPQRENSGNRRGSDEERVEDPGNPPNDRAGITPEHSAVEDFKSSDKSVKDMRELGFTASHVVPRDGMLPGKGSLFVLGDGDADQLLVKEDISMFAQFSPARRMYPGTTIGVMAKWRDLYRQADYISRHKKLYSESGGGTTRPKYDRATEAMFNVVDGSVPVYFKTPDALDIHKAVDLKETLGFNLALCEVNQAEYAMDALAEVGGPVFITLELPDMPDKKEKDEEDEETDPEKEALEKRRQESAEMYKQQAATIARAGLPVAFSTLEVKSKDLHANLLTMIEGGLNADTALAALTTIPAGIFGVDDVMGTVTAGKMANVFVSNKPYFEKDSKVKYVFVEGNMYEYEIKDTKKKKKGDSDEAPVEIGGKWSYEVDVMGQVYTGVLNFTGTDGDYAGDMTSDEDGETTALDNVAVDGNNVSFSMLMDNSGMEMRLDFELEMAQEDFEGDVSVGTFGTFEIEGSRIPN